jgi:hypothetical protein
MGPVSAALHLAPPHGELCSARALLQRETTAARRAFPGGATVAGLMPSAPRRAPTSGSCGRSPRELRLGAAARTGELGGEEMQGG